MNKANITLLFISVFAVATLSGCSSAKDSELKVDFPSSTTFAVPRDNQSCSSPTAGDLKRNSFSYPIITLAWTNPTDSVYVVAIKLDFKSPSLSNGGYTCLITGDEIGAIFSTGGAPWNAKLFPPVGTTPGLVSITNTCTVKCGNVQFPDGVATSTAIGTVTVTGIQRSPNGDEKPVKATTQIKLSFGL